MRDAHFKVHGRLDGNGRTMPGTLTIERDAGLVSVRPQRRHRIYTLTLSDVADMIVARVIRAEVFAKRLAKAKKGGR